MISTSLTFDKINGWNREFPNLDSERTLIMVFGATEYLDDPEALVALSEAFPSSHVIGCSTSGEISGTTICDDSLSVAITKFERTGLRFASAPVASADGSFDAGAAIARDLRDEALRGIFVLSDGLNVNGSELVRGINSILDDSVVVTGGLAGDGSRFERTWVLHEGRPQAGFVSAVGMYGDRVRIGHGSRGGWIIFGPERKVTRAIGNVLYELDGKPALELYKTYLGDKASELPAAALLFPLSLRLGSSHAKNIVRTILSIDEETQSMTFAGDIPEGCLVQLMQANHERLIEGAEEAAQSVEQEHRRDNMLSVAISCIGRRLVLGERTEEELEAVRSEFPHGTSQVGFYSYGEISPYDTGFCDLHNQTMTLTTIGED